MCRVPVRCFLFIGAVLAVGLLMHCGQSPEGRKKTETQKVSNRPPVIRSAEIQPAAPTVQDDLGVAVRSSDPDDDFVSYRFQWIVNDEEISEWTGDTLPIDMFQKADEVRCMIVPTDGKKDGRPFVTRSVRIANSLPVIEQIEIRPEVLFPGDEAQVVVKVRDADQDPVSLSYEWFVNDRSAQNDDPRFPLTKCHKKDLVSVRVRASDGEGTGPWIESKGVVVQNRPPSILSRPPEKWNETKGFHYIVRTADPDGDPVQIKLNGDLPSGMLWDEDAGILTWKPHGDAPRSCKLEIIADDNNGGTCKQQIILNLGSQ